MISRGIATFTLDYGTCPKWLFERMVKLGREMTDIIVAEFGADEFVKRIADPVWFQSLGTVLAFDWNASGLTTILTAALKEGIRGRENDLGLYIAGGKGKTSKKTPDQITEFSELANLDQKVSKNLVYNSKMAAKVDSSLLQDGYQLYHHTMFFARSGSCRSLPSSLKLREGTASPLACPMEQARNGVAPPASNNSPGIVWSVVQQGMNTTTKTARRYHWYSDNIKDIVVEPHSGIASQAFGTALNLSAIKSDKTRDLSVDLVQGGYTNVMKEIMILRRHSSNLSSMVKAKKGEEQLTLLQLHDVDFNTHPVLNEDFSKSKYLEKVLFNVTEQKPESYEKLLSIKGVGPKTMRALSLVSEVIYGAKPSYEDPARYSFAHGGKDMIPYPVDTHTYDNTIEFFKKVVYKMKLESNEKRNIIYRLENQ